MSEVEKEEKKTQHFQNLINDVWSPGLYRYFTTTSVELVSHSLAQEGGPKLLKLAGKPRQIAET